MNRALPARMIDKIRDGVPPPEMAKRGDRAVFTALVSTAASAQMRGWDLWEWESLVLEPKSHLGTQLRLKGGKRARTPMVVHKTLGDAWEKAWEWRTDQDAPWDALLRCARWRRSVEERRMRWQRTQTPTSQTLSDRF